MPGNAQTQQSSSSLGLGPPRRLGEHNTRALALTISFRATLSGPDARQAATDPYTHVRLRSATPASSRPGQQKDRAGSVPSVHSMPLQHSLLFRLRPVEADNAWQSRLAASYPVPSHRPGLLATDRGHGDGHASGQKLRLLIRTCLGAVQLSLLGQLYYVARNLIYRYQSPKQQRSGSGVPGD